MDPARDDVVTIETPEHVVFHYRLAGLPSRLVAGFVDLCLQILIFLVFFFLLTIIVGGAASGGLTDLADMQMTGWAMGLLILFMFVDLWGYYIFFEIYMDGQTPGKRTMKMRVIRDNGTALTPAAVLVRNLCRAVDFLPGMYGLAIVVMAANRHSKRIGDFAGGTIVVRDGLADEVKPRVGTRQLKRTADDGQVSKIKRAGVHRLSNEEIQLIERFVSRMRDLDPEARRKLAQQIGDPIAKRMGVQVRTYESFLRQVLLAQRQLDGDEEGGS